MSDRAALITERTAMILVLGAVAIALVVTGKPEWLGMVVLVAMLAL